MGWGTGQQCGAGIRCPWPCVSPVCGVELHWGGTAECAAVAEQPMPAPLSAVVCTGCSPLRGQRAALGLRSAAGSVSPGQLRPQWFLSAAGVREGQAAEITPWEEKHGRARNNCAAAARRRCSEGREIPLLCPCCFWGWEPRRTTPKSILTYTRGF